MIRAGKVALLACGIAGIWPCGPVQAQTFTGLGLLPGTTETYALGLSRDGAAVVGYGNPRNSGRAFRWTRSTGLQDLGVLPGGTAAGAAGAANQGATVVGWSLSATSATAFRWTAAGGLQPLPPVVPGDHTYANAMTPDGAVTVGNSGSALCRWTAAGVQLLSGAMPQSPTSFSGISDDGSVAVGTVIPYVPGAWPFRWTSAGGLERLSVPQGFGQAYAWGVSPDGTTIYGEMDSTPTGGVHAFRWTAAGGMEDIGAPAGLFNSSAYAGSSDGSVVVGAGGPAGPRAVVWSDRLGVLDLNTYLPTLGVNLTGWSLNFCNGVSADGLTISGQGTHNGHVETFVVVLPGACGTADFNHDGDTATDADIEAFFACLGGSCCAACDSADFNGDGDVGTDADIEAFFRVLAGGSC